MWLADLKVIDYEFLGFVKKSGNPLRKCLKNMLLIICVNVKINAGLEIPSLKMYWSTPTTHTIEKKTLTVATIINIPFAYIYIWLKCNPKSVGYYTQHRNLAQFGRALALGARSQRFKSFNSDQTYGGIEQW